MYVEKGKARRKEENMIGKVSRTELGENGIGVCIFIIAENVCSRSNTLNC